MKLPTFKAFDTKTNKWLEGDYACEFARNETDLIYTDIEGVAICDGIPYLLDECGNWYALDPKRFKIYMELNNES